MSTLAIHSAQIESFKNITSVAFTAEGRHVTLKGMNGRGKTAILQALMTALVGKEVLPDDPILHGEESAKIRLNLGDGATIKYTVAVHVGKGGETFNLTLKTFDEEGNTFIVPKPVTFLKKLILGTALNPQEFFDRKDSEQLQMLYDLMPDLHSEIERLDREYAVKQAERSEINKDGQRLKVDLERTVFTSDLPEEEEDPAVLMQELQNAQNHNQKKGELEKKVTDLSERAQKTEHAIDQSKSKIADIEAQIAVLQKTISDERDIIDANTASVAATRKEQDTAQRALNAFEEKPLEPIQERISGLKDRNEKIRQNQEHRRLAAMVEQKRTEYTEKYQEMKAIAEQRDKVISGAHMPIKGLTVGEGCLLYPDPHKGDLVRLNSLSTGQRWKVVLAIYAAMGRDLKSMFIPDRNSMDRDNLRALYEAAEEHGIQLVFHQTVEEDEGQCVIVIESDAEKA